MTRISTKLCKSCLNEHCSGKELERLGVPVIICPIKTKKLTKKEAKMYNKILNKFNETSKN